MEGTNEGMIAIVQGLQDAGLAVTVTDMKQFDQLGIQRTLLENSSSLAKDPAKTSSGVQTFQSSPTKNCNRTSAENLQGSSQHFGHSNQNNQNHSRGGVCSSARNSSSLGLSQPYSAVMPVSHVQPYRPPSFWDNWAGPAAPRTSRVADSFAKSLRKYPVLVERTTSADLIQKLLAFTQNKNASKHFRSRSMRSLSHESPYARRNAAAIVRKSSKNIQTYTRARPSSPEFDVSNIYGKAERRRRISPVKSDRGNLCSTSSRHRDTVSASYDYLKISSPRLSARSQECRYLSDVTRYVRDTLKQMCEDEPRVCPRMASRYNQHRRSHHKAEVATEATAETKEKERTSSTRASGSSCTYGSPSTSAIKKQISQSNECFKQRRQQCRDQLLCDYCHQSLPCGCSVQLQRQKSPKQIKFDALYKELVFNICPSDESLKEECPCPGDIEIGIDFIVDHWLKDVPVYADFIIKDEEVRNRLVKDLKANLKRDIGQDNICKLDILECLNSLPMWIPPDFKDQKDFKENLADNLLQRLKEAKNVSRYIKVVKKWLDTFPLKQQVDYDIIAAEITNKLAEAMFLNDSDNKRNLIREIAMNELYKLPVDIHPALKDRFLLDLADNLADMLLRDDFDDIVYDWVLMLPLNIYPPVNRNQFASDFSKKLKSVICTEVGSKADDLTTATIEELYNLPIDCNSSERDRILPRLAKNLVDKLLRHIKEKPSVANTDSDRCATIVSDWVKSLPLKPYPVIDLVSISKELTKKIKDISNNSKPQDRKMALVKAITKQLKDLPIDCDPDDKEKFLPELALNLADKLVEAIEKDESADKVDLPQKSADLTDNTIKDLLQDMDKSEFDNAVRDWVDNLPLKSHPYVDRNKLANEQIKLLEKVLASTTPTNRQDAIKDALVNELSKLPIDCPLSEIDKLLPKLAENLAKKLANPAQRDEIDNIVRNWMQSIPCESLSPAEKNEIGKDLTQKIKELKNLLPEERKNAIKDVVCQKLSNLPIDCEANMKHNLVSDLADKLANEIVRDQFEEVVESWVTSLPLKPNSNIDKNLVTSDLTNRCKNAVKNRDPDLIRRAIKDLAVKKLQNLPIECPSSNKYDMFSNLADNLANNLLKIINNGEVPSLMEKVPQIFEPIEDKDTFTDTANDGDLFLKNEFPSTLADTPVRDKLAEIIQDWTNTVPFKSPIDRNELTNNLTKNLNDIKSNTNTICDENALKDAIFKELRKYSLNTNSSEKISLAANLAKQLTKLLDHDQTSDQNSNHLIEDTSDDAENISQKNIGSDDDHSTPVTDGDSGLITENSSRADDLSDISKAELPKKYSINTADWLKDITSPITKQETQKLVRKVLAKFKKLKSDGVDENDINDIIKKDIEDDLDSIIKSKGSKIDKQTQIKLAKKIYDQLIDTFKKRGPSLKVQTKQPIEEYEKDVLQWFKENPDLIPSQGVEQLANEIAHCLADYTVDKKDSKITKDKMIDDIKNKISPALQKTALSSEFKRKLAENLYNKLQNRKARSGSKTLKAKDLPSSNLSPKDKRVPNNVKKEINNWIKENPELSNITNEDKNILGDTLSKSIQKINGQGLSKIKAKKKITNVIKNNLDMLLVKHGKEIDSNTKYKLTGKLLNRLKESIEVSSVSNSSSFSAQSQSKDIIDKVYDWIKNIPELAATSSLEKKSNKKLANKLANKLIDLKLKDLGDKQTRKNMKYYVKSSLESGLKDKGQQMKDERKDKLVKQLIENLIDDFAVTSLSTSNSPKKNGIEIAMKNQINSWIESIPELAGTTALEIQDNNKMATKLVKQIVNTLNDDLDSKAKKIQMKKQIKNNLKNILEKKGALLEDKVQNKLADKLLNRLAKIKDQTETTSSTTPAVPNKNTALLQTDVMYLVESIPELTGKNLSEKKEKEEFAQDLSRKLTNLLAKRKDHYLDLQKIVDHEIEEWFAYISEMPTVEPLNKDLTDKIKSSIINTFNEINSQGLDDDELKRKMKYAIQNNLDKILDSNNNQLRKLDLASHLLERFKNAIDTVTSPFPTEYATKSNLYREFKNDIEDWLEEISELNDKNDADKKNNKKLAKNLATKFCNLQDQNTDEDKLKDYMLAEIKNKLANCLSQRGQSMNSKTRTILANDLLENLTNTMKKVEPTLKDNGFQSDISESDTSSSSSKTGKFEKVNNILQLESSTLSGKNNNSNLLRQPYIKSNSNLDSAPKETSNFLKKKALNQLNQIIESRVPDSYSTKGYVLSNVEKPTEQNFIKKEKTDKEKSQTDRGKKETEQQVLNDSKYKFDTNMNDEKILEPKSKQDFINHLLETIKKSIEKKEDILPNLTKQNTESYNDSQPLGDKIKDILDKKVEYQKLNDFNLLDQLQNDIEGKNKLAENPVSNQRNKHIAPQLKRALKANIEDILEEIPGISPKSASERKYYDEVSQNLIKTSQELRNLLSRDEILLDPKFHTDVALDKKLIPKNVKTRNMIANEILEPVEDTIKTVEEKTEQPLYPEEVPYLIKNNHELSSSHATEETGNTKLSGDLSNTITSVIELNDKNTKKPIEIMTKKSLNKAMSTKNRSLYPNENKKDLSSSPIKIEKKQNILQDNNIFKDINHNSSPPKANFSVVNNINKINKRLAKDLQLLEVENLNNPQASKDIILDIKDELERALNGSGKPLDSKMKKKLADDLMNTIVDSLNQQKQDAVIPHTFEKDISAWINDIPKLVGVGAYEKKQNENFVRDLATNLANLLSKNQIDEDIREKMRKSIKNKLISAIDERGEHIDSKTRAKLTNKLLDKVVKSAKLLDNRYDKIVRELMNQKEKLLSHISELPLTFNDQNEVGTVSAYLNSKTEINNKVVFKEKIKKHLDKSLKNSGINLGSDSKDQLAEKMINNLTDSDKLSGLPLSEHNYLGNIKNVVSNWHERVTGTSAGFKRQDYDAMIDELSKKIQKLLYSNKNKSDFEKYLKNCIRAHLVSAFEKNSKSLNNKSLNVFTNYLVKDVLNITDKFYQNLLRDSFKSWLENIFKMKTKLPSENKKLDRLAEKLVQIVNELQSNSAKEVKSFFNDIKRQIDTLDFIDLDTKTKNILAELLLAKVTQECKNTPAFFRGFQKDISQWLENIPEMISTSTSETKINDNISKVLSKKLANLQIMSVDDPDVQIQILEEIKDQLDVALEIKGQYMTPKMKDKFANKLLRIITSSTKAIQEENNKYTISLIWDWYHNVAFPLNDTNIENLYMIEQLNNKLQLIQKKTLSENSKILKMEKEVNNWLKLIMNQNDNGSDDETIQHLTKRLIDLIIPRKKSKTIIDEVKVYNLLSTSNTGANKNNSRRKTYMSEKKPEGNSISKCQSKQMLPESGYFRNIKPLIIGQVSQKTIKSKPLFRKHSVKTERNNRNIINFRPQTFNSQPRRNSSARFSDKKPEIYYLEESDDDKRRQSSQKSSLSKSGSVKEISKEINPEAQDHIRAILAENIHLMNTSQINKVKDKILRVLLDEAGLPKHEAESLLQSVVQKAQVRALEIDADEMDLLELIRDEILPFLAEYNMDIDKQEKLKEYLTDVIAKKLMKLDDDLDEETKAAILEEIQNKGNLNKDEAEELFERVLGQVTRMKSSPAISKSINRIKNGSDDKRSSLTLKEQTAFERKAKKIMKDFFFENLDDPTEKQQAKILDIIEDTVKNLENVLIDPDLDGDEKRQLMKNELNKQLRKLSFLNSDKSVSDLTQELMERLEDIKLKTSTPTKSSTDESTVSFSTSNIDSPISSDSGSRKGSKRDSSQSTSSSRRGSKDNEKENMAYKKKLETIIKDWLNTLPVDTTTLQDDNFKKTMIKDLAGDIIDRQKYLQLNPHVTTTDEEELENLKYQCYRWLSKFLDDKDLNTAVSKTDKLLEAIKGIKVPKLVKSVDDALEDKILSWMETAPLDIEPIVNTKEKHLHIKNLTDKIKNLKDQLNSDEKIREEIYKFLPKIYGDLDKTNLRKLGSSLFHMLMDQEQFSNDHTDSAFIDPLSKAVDEWTESLPIDVNIPESKNKLNDAKKDLKNKLRQIMQQFDPNIPQNIEILNDEIKKFIRTHITDPLKYDEKYLESKAKELMKMLREIPMQANKDGTKSKSLKKATDTLYDYIREWCENLPILGETEKIQLMKQNLSSELMNKINEQNMDPDILNDDVLYEDMLVDEVDKIVSSIPRNPELDKYIPALKKDLISKIMSARQMLRDELAGKAYKQQLRDTISTSMYIPENLSPDEIASFELLKDKLADAFIDLHFSPDGEDNRLKYKKKISEEVDRFSNNILRRYPCLPLNPNTIKRDLHHALLRVPAPKDDTMKTEVEQLRIRDIINEWMKEIPLRQESQTEKLHRHKVAMILAKRLHDIEVEKEVNHYLDADSKMNEAISKFLNKIPLKYDQEAIIPNFVSDLVYRLKHSEYSRKFECRRSKSTETQADVCNRYPCTLKEADKAHLLRIKERMNKSCYKHISTNPSLLIDCSSQTDSRSQFWIPHKTNQATKHVPFQNTCQPLLKNHASCMTTPNHCHITPRVMVKEYFWDSQDSKTPLSCSVGVAPISSQAAPVSPPVSCGIQSGPSQTAPLPQSYLSSHPYTTRRPSQSGSQHPYIYCPHPNEKEIPCTKPDEPKSHEQYSGEDSPNYNGTLWQPCNLVEKLPSCSNQGQRPQRSCMRTEGFESDWSTGFPKTPQNDFEDTCWRHRGKRIPRPFVKKRGQAKEKNKCMCKERVLVSCRESSTGNQYHDMCQTCGSNCPHPSYMYFRR